MSHHIVACSLLSAALVFAPALAHADRDAVQFGSDINVPQGESVHDAVCFFCNVNAEGSINHDVVVFFGNVHIAGHSDHDVVDFFGDVRADDNASIGHDVVNFFGAIRLGQNVSVGNDMVAMFGAIHAADTATVGGNRVVQPAWLLLIPLMIFGGIVILIVSVIQHFRRRQMYMGYPFPPPPHP
ncbi:MAG: hypothetical protein WCA11_19020 [Terracidiphilus sp.]